ncbi:CRISPR-associated protein Cas5 [Leptospira kirschneri]|uniref:CRISPR-associated protein Cas5 n=1 Tax=Leptospira kirschneri TaxID=29507 RepID=UPI0002784A42|nr:CRISPR-associated protein Cas5 [Leptospira kirschneri]EJO68236.1 putative CRISPR-associated protein Cas5/DevS, subtype MYXAN [Leptospira kirschneri serovar Grippotyphosa str. RM52]EKR08262.1 putative CRISPR-associated protein Cas5/DevS, subtype MYXAN [Leptospira kirschneri serovar Valbuzzi str. 200702274]EMK02761.1 putative CRISPR-associated protein Cas5/DevS, subtype MYXAN [Leptospira kirschneri str. MMD1493]EMK14190.1 putative CRISPR-associated protein Cas5/DevS, subtype MYXAN [Leptospira 
MEEFFIHIKAPFAAYRYFQAGNYRTTMPTIPHSAAYGLILNFAGIEMRTAVNEMTTLIKNVVKDYSFENEDFIPSLEIAIGDIENAKKGSVYQQLHTYPVGDASKGFREGTKGAKYHIIPTRREFLVGLNTMIGVRTNLSGFMKKIQSGLNGDIENRYGLPFAGDNNLLFNFLEIYEEAIYPATWYYPVTEDEIPETETVRLTVGIDRLNNSKTTAPLFATTKEKSLQPPPNAWVWTPKEPESI